MRTVLICHHDEPLNRELLPRWLASFSQLAGVVIIEEPRQAKIARTKRERRRVGFFRLLDVLAFRLYYALRVASADRVWTEKFIDAHNHDYPALPDDVPILTTDNPNRPEVVSFLKDQNPDIVLARCKNLLKPDVFTIPTKGTFVLHPGICPEYRNAHGCFWALVERDLENVGATLLKIDRGIDTGPVFQYLRVALNEVEESHIRIQDRVVVENLEVIQQTLCEINDGSAVPIDTTGRESKNWGQPWLSAWWQWKQAARKLAAETA